MAQALSASEQHVASVLDDDLGSDVEDFEPGPKRMRMSRKAVGTVAVDLGEPYGSVDMLSPTCFNANMKVKIDEDTISAVIAYLRKDLTWDDLVKKRPYTRRNADGAEAEQAAPSAQESHDGCEG